MYTIISKSIDKNKIDVVFWQLTIEDEKEVNTISDSKNKMIAFDDLSNLLKISYLCNIHPIVSKSIVKDKIDVVSKLASEDKKVV